MDDVVADWMGYAQAFLKMRWDDRQGERIPQEDWNRLKEDHRFYSRLPIKKGAYELVNYCQSAVLDGRAGRLAFLTALPHDYSGQYASWDKCWWADQYFPNIPVFFGPFSHDKWRHCKPGDILIDDRHSNCSEWQSVGGQAHVYTSWEQCYPWLEQALKKNG